MSYNKQQFRSIIERVLKSIDLHSEAAENLLLGTAAQESGFGTYLRQMGSGPARGPFQMEPTTEWDHWMWLANRPDIRILIAGLTGVRGPEPDSMEWNLAYSIAMARVHYLRVPASLPGADDLAGLAAYWKRYYNTRLGKGTEEEFISNYRRYVG